MLRQPRVDCWLGVKFEDNRAKLGNPKTFGESEVGPSDYIPWHYTSVRARLATRDAKGFSRTVQLYPLALRLLS
jgi:hypothetical protein